MQNNEKIPNLASEFKSDKIWAFFYRTKLSEIDKIPDLAHFDSFLAKKGVKSDPIWILRLDLKSSDHLAYFSHPFDMISHFDFLTSHAFSKKGN